MSKETVFRIIGLFLALLGLIIVWQSPIWGLKAVPGIILQLGLISGDIQNQVIYDGPVAALRIIGAVLLGVGLWRAVDFPRNERIV
jgi:uncharacterized protein YjeT (DUF2065 family)